MPRLDRRALRLYLVFGPQDLPENRQSEELIKQAVAGGVTCVQWRDKTALAQSSVRDRANHAEPLRALADQLGVPFLINDDVELAAALHADGVHLGQDDVPPSAARKQLGDGAIIGWSVGTAAERQRLDALLRSDPDLIDYIGVGPAFPTGTKADAGAALGAAGINRVVAGLSPSLPRVAIGGINADNLGQLRSAHIDGAAVVSAIARSTDPRAAAQQLTLKLKNPVST